MKQDNFTPIILNRMSRINAAFSASPVMGNVDGSLRMYTRFIVMRENQITLLNIMGIIKLIAR